MLSCIQVLLFGVLAIEVKNKAPNAHTFLEMVDVRWGKAAHVTFLFFGFRIVKWGGARSESRTRHLLSHTSMLVAAAVTACPTHLYHEIDM